MKQFKKILRDESGLALVITLMVVALSAGLALESTYLARLDINSSGNFRDQARVHNLAYSGVNWARALLKEDAKGEKVDSLAEAWARERLDYFIEGGRLSFQIRDEESKLNLNLLVKDGKVDEAKREIFGRLMDQLGQDASLLAAIIDWLDKDDEAQPGGAEREYYANLSPPYIPRNGPLESLSELLLVKGFTPEVSEKLAPYVTVNSTGKVNINTAPAVVIQSLSEKIDSAMAKELISFRDTRPFAKLDEVKGVSEKWANLLSSLTGLIDVRSENFTILSQASLGAFRATIRALVKREGDKVQPIYWVRG